MHRAITCIRSHVLSCIRRTILCLALPFPLMLGSSGGTAAETVPQHTLDKSPPLSELCYRHYRRSKSHRHQRTASDISWFSEQEPPFLIETMEVRTLQLSSPRFVALPGAPCLFPLLSLSPRTADIQRGTVSVQSLGILCHPASPGILWLTSVETYWPHEFLHTVGTLKHCSLPETLDIRA